MTLSLISPQITTIIPTYRRPHMLKRAILSVLNQSYNNIKICIYDNASGDETASIVSALAQTDSRIVYQCHPQNIGMAKNFNCGFSHIKTPFFSLLCDDDLLLPDFYANAIKGFNHHPAAMFSGGTVLGFLEETQDIIDIPQLVHEGLLSPPQGLIQCILGHHPLVTGVLYRKQVIENIGLWEEDVITADIHFQMRATAKYPHLISKQPYAIVTTHLTNATNQVRDGNSFAELYARQINIVKNELGLTNDLQAEIICLMNERSKRVLFKTGLGALSNADSIAVQRITAILTNQFNDKTRAYFLNWSSKFLMLLNPNNPVFRGLRTARRAIRKQQHQDESHYLDIKKYIAALNQQCGI